MRGRGTRRSSLTIDVLHVDALEPFLVQARRRLLQAHLELPVAVDEMNARVVEHRHVLAILRVAELVRAPGVVH